MTKQAIDKSIQNFDMEVFGAFSKDRIFIVGSTASQKQDGSSTQTVLRRKNGVWKSFKSPAAACIVGRLVPELEIFIVGAEGIILKLSLPKSEIEEIPEVAGIGYLRSSAYVDGDLWVAGMGRQVYKRTAQNKYEGLSPKSKNTQDLDVGGFNALVPGNCGGCYVAGFEGEIWYWNGDQWNQENSPTQNVINAGALLPNGDVIFVGKVGEIIIGQKGNWRMLSQELVKTDFWSVCPFKGKVYFATHKKVFVLDEAYEFQESSLKEVPSLQAGQLSSADGVLWSCGASQLYWTEDGQKWHLEKIECADL